jgi:hypothetical protein
LVRLSSRRGYSIEEERSMVLGRVAIRALLAMCCS